ncbi:hypothetical protein D0N73_04370 [Pseudomonas fluorescens]|uniref:DUF1835 domain-containing protein n=2 Tax=Pseudomonas fluorescens TaxID=294 RepID=A0ABY1TC74_PSEFL|nr:hypothetical protein B0A76_15475 [Pseudomonas fluorescens]RFP97250.1 hypothetical protein D0N73_04370 [Pseudomonas fluorescens]SNY09970.1 hypothetical protein SAMN04488487_2967 [Pseudomonas fluorescens]SQF89481.1 Uncharacterised protein [Pseudomonas fluorescens]
MHERLIIVSGHSAYGSVRASQISDRVEMITDRLVWGPVELNTNDPAIFRDQRFASWDAAPNTSDQPESWEREDCARRLEWAAHIPSLAEYARIELWMDPDSNGQLQLLYLLHWFSSHKTLASKLFIAQIKHPLGETRPYEHGSLSPYIFQASEREIDLAINAWNAFRQPTPQAWCALLTQDLDSIPGLRRTVGKMLAELPAAGTGLRASERRLLELVASDRASLRHVMSGMTHSVFGYWELGRLLNALGRGPHPAITGIEDVAFDLALHEHAQRFNAYTSSTLKLSAFGRSLLRGEDSLIRKAPRHFWWGGTLITSERPWCWSAQEEILSC